ncbi:hypothetical protein N7454_006365, partial [Penicillium verhagenii]
VLGPLNFSIASRSSSSQTSTPSFDFTSFTTDNFQQPWLPAPAHTALGFQFEQQQQQQQQQTLCSIQLHKPVSSLDSETRFAVATSSPTAVSWFSYSGPQSDPACPVSFLLVSPREALSAPFGNCAKQLSSTFPHPAVLRR